VFGSWSGAGRRLSWPSFRFPRSWALARMGQSMSLRFSSLGTLVLPHALKDCVANACGDCAFKINPLVIFVSIFVWGKASDPHRRATAVAGAHSRGFWRIQRLLNARRKQKPSLYVTPDNSNQTETWSFHHMIPNRDCGGSAASERPGAATFSSASSAAMQGRSA